MACSPDDVLQRETGSVHNRTPDQNPSDQSPSMDEKLPNRFQVHREASESNIDNGAKSRHSNL